MRPIQHYIIKLKKQWHTLTYAFKVQTLAGYINTDAYNMDLMGPELAVLTHFNPI